MNSRGDACVALLSDMIVFSGRGLPRPDFETNPVFFIVATVHLPPIVFGVIYFKQRTNFKRTEEAGHEILRDTTYHNGVVSIDDRYRGVRGLRKM